MPVVAQYHPMANGHAPAWASAWGQDQYGIWAEFTVQTISQRLRWIPAGRFLMGSPESEEDRYYYEGPQQTITHAHGFWLADTPCTQALWQQVMKENPSRFEGDETCPVEQVSFEDVARFLTQLNDSVPGLQAGLPSEAQWEYACRANSTGPDWFSGTDSARAEMLQQYAWFAGNADGKTQPVVSKAANPWGLYDMLGNVWEWCADGWQADHQGADANGAARSTEAQAGRVLRGGSWRSLARALRAAFRLGSHPGNRNDYFGFRLALVPLSSSTAEPEGAERKGA